MMNGKVLALYMTMPDMMRSGHRMTCEDIECDPDGIIGDMNYETSEDKVMLLTSQKSYDIAEEEGIMIDQGVLMESIHVDVDINGLKTGSMIEVGDAFLEVTGMNPMDTSWHLLLNYQNYSKEIVASLYAP